MTKVFYSFPKDLPTWTIIKLPTPKPKKVGCCNDHCEKKS